MIGGWIQFSPATRANPTSTEIQEAIEKNALAFEITRLAPYGAPESTVPLSKNHLLPLISQMEKNKKESELQKTSAADQTTISFRAKKKTPIVSNRSLPTLPEEIIRIIANMTEDGKTETKIIFLAKKNLVTQKDYERVLADKKNPLPIKNILRILQKCPALKRTVTSLSVLCNFRINNTDGSLRILPKEHFPNMTEIFIKNQKIWKWLVVVSPGDTNLEIKNSKLKIFRLVSDDFCHLKRIPSSVEELTLASPRVYDMDLSITSLEGQANIFSKIKKLTLEVTLDYPHLDTLSFYGTMTRIIAKKVKDITVNLKAIEPKYLPEEKKFEEESEPLNLLAALEQKIPDIRDFFRRKILPGQKITINYAVKENETEVFKQVVIE